MSKKGKKVKIRQFWSIDPVTKVEADKTQEYDRAQSKRDFLQEMEEELHQSNDWEEFDQ